MQDFSDKTIKPLKKDLSQLKIKTKQQIINSVMTCINSNTNKIKVSQQLIQKEVDPLLTVMDIITTEGPKAAAMEQSRQYGSICA
jgi:hypothetical protein